MASDTKTPEGFSLRRWSRRKLEAASEQAVKEPDAAPAPAPAVPSAPGASAAAVEPRVPAQAELPPVESLTPESDFTAFMQPGVDSGVRRQALKTLFTDPRFNVMDGLDVYIDDYTKADPIPASVLERLAQSGFIRGLGAPRPEEPASTAAAAVTRTDAVAAETTAPNAPDPAPAENSVSPDPAPERTER